ncbi:HNH endonuclease [Acinetobacter baumannii]|uniref:HNH endonuclease n=1 Tax=Acinetobacter baumannii TaxID=470 RepID=UPI001D280FE3|nr:HNH endonuclease [Acinetobacter baumannii]EHU2375549.1 HNH endonuclease [Acinetobacter baumannii]EHU2751552.1 HNH endonuclease [Acinetobacter baumannii]MDC4281937.1 HNH endonuclease [Acinetobacter baumannii]MDC4285662.1 HNH endonuclease [Acinetobacter baumannii]MDC4288847.1 HNH endonuclease [Acinetobacter baumannii]
MSENYEICRYCQKEYAVDYYYKINKEVILCNTCANLILNVVHKAQYGRFVSWSEDIKPSPPRYTKKKIGTKLRLQVYERDGFKCVTCGTQKNLTLDHIKPEIKGGDTSFENLQTMCKSCNSSKGARYVETLN